MNATDMKIDDVITNAVLARREQIVQGFVEASIEQLKHSLDWKTQEAVAEIVKSFIESDVMPEVRARLEERKVEIVETIVTSLMTVFTTVGDALAKKTAENLTISYKSRQIFSALFE